MGATLNNLGQFFSGTLFGIMGQSRNDKYTSQPDFFFQPAMFNRQEQWVTIAGQEQTIYLTTPELKLVIDRMALMFANGIWRHLDANDKEIENSEFKKLLDNPNIFQSSNEYLFQYWIQRSIYANVFIFQNRASQLQEVPTALWNLSPSRMVVNRTGKVWRQKKLEEIISSYTFKMMNEGLADEHYKTKEIIQFSMPNSDDPIVGISPFNALRMPISNIRAAYGYGNVILTKKGALGVWSSDSKDGHGSMALTDPEVEKIEKQLLKSYGIGDHQRSIAVSNQAIKFTPATYPVKDLLLQETIDAGKRVIIDMYGGNDNMFSKPKGSKFDNILEGERIAYNDTIIPAADDLANGLAKRWGILDNNESLVLDYSHVPALKEDESAKTKMDKSRAETIAILVANGMKFEDAATLINWDIAGASITPPTSDVTV